MNKPLAQPGRFHVNCLLVTNGQAFSDWDFTFHSLKDAEECCEAQMAPSEDSLVLGHNFPCNKTSDAFVNCTISFLSKSGKWLKLEERIHSLQPCEKDE